MQQCRSGTSKVAAMRARPEQGPEHNKAVIGMSETSPDDSPPAGLPDLSGAAVLVTGASGTLGSGIARRFAAAGADVALHYHRGERAASALAAELSASGRRAVPLAADLSDPRAAAALVAAAAEHLGGLDGLVNNAGIQPVTALSELTSSEWQRVVDTNLTGVFSCTRAAAEVMAAHRGGSVTHIASI
jgi:glucose 1-dehydrogenase/3-oxoacyl-[acyl-carrier protein] reductase